MIHVILYRPEKPLNTGNIMRTCMAVKAKLHIIGPITFSLEEKDLKRAGLDYIESLDYSYYQNLEEFNKNHSNINIYYISRYGEKVYSSVDFSDPVNDIYVMFGRESTGIPHEILRENMDRVLRLPMVPNARSLNLSNCVAIVVYEILRQQKYNDLSTSEAIKGNDFLEKESNKS